MISMSACVMLLAAISKGSDGQTVEQSEGLEIIPQGSKLSLKCSYQSSFTTNYPFWYIQNPGQAPKLLMAEFAKELSNEGHLRGFSAIHEKNKKTFNLEKAAIQLNDSAAYFCAVSDLNYGFTIGSGTRLVVLPNLKTSEPSIYKLQPSKEGDRDISACLITDYFPAPITVGADINNSEKVNGSVVVVKENGKETPSYGTVVWGKGKKAGDCYAEYNNTRFQPESAEAATTCSEKTTGGFETDERLNLLSLTVLGLRVIFLKCVAFNLLFTFHAWSS